MKKEIYCMNCGLKIGNAIVNEYGTFRLGGRDDKHFCSDKCTAAYHREHTAPHIHADLPRNMRLRCVVCLDWFTVNDYAKRSGQREALYCGSACRQKAYRRRKKDGGAGEKIRNGHFWLCQTKDCGQRRFTEPMGDKCGYCGKSNWLAI